MDPQPKALLRPLRARTPAGALRRLGANLVTHDILIVLFHAYVLLWSLTIESSSEDAIFGKKMAWILFAVTASTVLLVRAEILPAGKLQAAIYRAGIIVPLPVSYFEVSALLRAAEPRLLDQELWAIDRALFGTTPAEWLTRFNGPGVNEWFSFFYQSYYLILVCGLFLPPLLDRGRSLGEVMLAAAIVGVVGHLGYTFVPGLGPHVTAKFSEPVAGGYWYGTVAEMLRIEASMDIFPSLHTGMTSVFALHAIRQRKRPLYRFVWPVLAFFALNILVATMLLRLHWGIDIVAGLALAVGALLLASRVAEREARRGIDDDRQRAWPPLMRWQRQG